MTSSLDTLYKKMASSLESNGAGHMLVAKSDPARHISPVVAHELNNLLTIIQGYADRLMMKNGENPALTSQLKLISEAAKRASTLVHTARTSSEANPPARPQPGPQPAVPVA